MPIECRQSTTGGKGNRGMFIERDPKIVAAGLPTAQQNSSVSDGLQHYLLQEEADALIGDAIIPAPKERSLPPLRKPIPLDKRFAGIFCDVAKLVNPPSTTKFQALTADFKETAYKSYWKAPISSVRDPVPMLPEGFDVHGTTFGKATAFHGRLYDIVMPKQPYPDKDLPSKRPGVQANYNYCSPPYNSDLTYGHRTFVDKRGTYARCCLTDDRVALGATNKVVVNSKQSNFQDANQSRLGTVLAPNNNIGDVPEGYTFGILKLPDNLPECLAICEFNKGVLFFRKCLKHLNIIRKTLSTRFLPTFFHQFYLTLKYYDIEKSDWISKDIVYKHCGINLIRFDPTLIEPLLSTLKAFNGSRIEYKTFVRLINYRIPLPEMPKVSDFKPDCLDYRTTYTEMVKVGKETDDSRMAGIPSGRYFDLDFPISPEGCIAGIRVCLPQESDIRSCIAPSILTHTFVDHRDMYQKQEPKNVRRVFEAAGEEFTDDKFNSIWEEAKKLHSKGWVCYETFRKTLEKHS